VTHVNKVHFTFSRLFTAILNTIKTVFCFKVNSAFLTLLWRWLCVIQQCKWFYRNSGFLTLSSCKRSPIWRLCTWTATPAEMNLGTTRLFNAFITDLFIKKIDW